MRNLAKRHPGAVIVLAIAIYIAAGYIWLMLP